jgi:hypothetical protein
MLEKKIEAEYELSVGERFKLAQYNAVERVYSVAFGKKAQLSRKSLLSQLDELILKEGKESSLNNLIHDLLYLRDILEKIRLGKPTPEIDNAIQALPELSQQAIALENTLRTYGKQKKQKGKAK